MCQKVYDMIVIDFVTTYVETGSDIRKERSALRSKRENVCTDRSQMCEELSSLFLSCFADTLPPLLAAHFWPCNASRWPLSMSVPQEHCRMSAPLAVSLTRATADGRRGVHDFFEDSKHTRVERILHFRMYREKEMAYLTPLGPCQQLN